MTLSDVHSETGPGCEIAGFVDAHCHLLRQSTGAKPPYDWTDSDSIAAWHRAVADSRSTPMDQPPEPAEARDLTEAIDAGLRRAATLGLVEVTEAGLADVRHLDALKSLRERGPLPVRVRVLVASGVADGRAMARLGDPWLEVIGVKFYADGWLGSRTCALENPFSDRTDDTGVLFLTADELARRAAPFAESGWTIATHAIGDRAIAAVLDAYEHIYGSDCRAAAPRVEHAQVLRPDLVDRIADLGVVACIQPGFAASDASTAAAALGERASDAYGWANLLDAGVRVIAGSDHPIEPLSPLEGLRRLVTGRVSEAAEAAPHAATLAVEDALSVMTDETAGTTVLDRDPRDVDPGLLSRLSVIEARANG